MPCILTKNTRYKTPYECPKFSLLLKHNNTIAQLLFSLLLKHNNTIAQLLFSPSGLIIVRFLITVPLKQLSCVLSSVYTVTSNFGKFRRVQLGRY